MKHVASIDVGSNSVVLSICELKNNQLSEIKHMSFVTRLGKDLESNQRFCDDSIKETLNAFRAIKEALIEFNVSETDLYVVATEASRVASNRTDLFKSLEDLIGVKPELVSGEKEAQLCLLGQRFLNENMKRVILVDIGGASTEIIDGEVLGNRVVSKYINSFKTGVVKLKDLHSVEKVKLTLEEVFFDLDDEFFKGNKIFFSAGTMTAFASMLLRDQFVDHDKINGLCLNSDFISAEIAKFVNMADNLLLREFPQLGKRVETIKYGLLLIDFFIRNKSLEEMVFTTYGLRHGVLIERCFSNGT